MVTDDWSEFEHQPDEEVSNPRREGWIAFEAGTPRRADPYPADTAESAGWRDGWDGAEKAYASAAGAPGSLLAFAGPLLRPERAYRCHHCGTTFTGLYHCQTLGRGR